MSVYALDVNFFSGVSMLNWSIFLGLSTLYSSLFSGLSTFYRSPFFGFVCALHVNFFLVCLRSTCQFLVSVYALQVSSCGLSTLHRSVLGFRLRSIAHLSGLSVLHRSLFGVCLRFAGEFWGLPALYRLSTL